MSESNRIPKIIHYCWFGKNPLSEMAVKCIESWKKYCPDYEIIEWNENNFDIEMNDYVKEAYQNKKWAFVSDVARLYALVNHGGIYMDTDVEVIKPIDDLLKYEAVSGFETETQITTGLMGCVKGHRMFVEFLDDYKDCHFIKPDGSLDMSTNVIRITNTCRKYGLKENNSLQTINGFTLFPRDYLCPKNHRTNELNLTKNTYTIHHFDGSWHTDEEKCCRKYQMKFKRIPMGGYLAKFLAAVKYRGFFAAIKDLTEWISKKKS